MDNGRTIRPGVARELGHYVYLYVNPMDESVYYVGKGKGSRALAHLDGSHNPEVDRINREIRAAGLEPRIDILAHGLPSERVALQLEAAAIDLLGVQGLANAVRGYASRRIGRAPLDELVARYSRKEAEIREPAILIRINRLYRYGMTPHELYDATRSAWVVGERGRRHARLACAVFEGVIREVYSITGWLPNGSTFTAQAGGRATEKGDGRWEFVGTLAEEGVRQRYLNRYVGHLFSQGAQNPIRYVNIPGGRHGGTDEPESEVEQRPRRLVAVASADAS